MLVAYCDPFCRFQDRTHHAQYCTLPFLDSTWVPSWSVEGRQPTFGREGYVAPFATHKTIWGDVPALDILKLDQNEGVQYHKDLALLFAASGDLRNVIKTVTSLPWTFRNDLTITINDNDLDVVARNIILLLTALLSAKPEDAATRMIHIWYSASIRQSDLEFLHGVVRPNIESVCSNLEGEDLDRLHSGTFSRGSYSWVNVVLPKKSWLALLKYLQVPEGLTIDQARQVRTAVTLPAGHLDFIEHNYFPLLPAQRICWHRFRLDGVLLPFGASRKPFDTPNPTLFHSAHWPYRGDLQPIHGWDFGEVIKVSTGAASMDHYGKLFYYLQEVFVKFSRDLRSRNLYFRLYNQDIQHLAGKLGAQSFARIELSNLSEEPYIDPGLASRCLVPLLQVRTMNPYATLIMLFTKAVWAQINTSYEIPAMAKCAPTMATLIPQVVMPPDKQDPIVSKFLLGMGLIIDVDNLFDKYLASNQAHRMNCGSMAVKENHTIVEKWPFRPKLTPGQCGTPGELAVMLSSAALELARYVEYRSLLS
ncbi:DUF4470 domain-containing protein [Fusarium keratoplasticum]|uniref:DUF4470 domain-containing protein n=1 Tax=Fusarium keratoplasticum TaxID=1328300 RepID=A0ACC0QJ84_9HYPO|nr:DUF4470 domain-containing protein [Fusarium keratoplasticum]KAI8654751.1 DUF4470 domain-containing protein [Fusarium keratoplasticum]